MARAAAISVNFEILGETADLLVVNKPAGVLVHPSTPDSDPTLWDELKALLSYEIANGGQVSLINRLDRETSGIVLVAKSAAAARTASIAMQNGKISKVYFAVVWGWPACDRFTVDDPILRQGEVEPSRIWLKRKIHPEGAASRTEFEVVDRVESNHGRFALVRARPLTGRTHQIRIHLSHVGFPVVGDKIYGPSEDCYLEFIETGWTERLAGRLILPRHALHSSEISLDWSGERLGWKCQMPPDILDLLKGNFSLQTKSS